jgi:outer membrane protein insertion porin family
MKISRLALSPVLCLLVFGLCALPARGQTGEPSAEIEVASAITALEISGNQTVPAKEIMNAIFARVGDTLSEAKIREDQKAIYALGYFADVSPSFEAYKDGTKVVFNVVENPRLEGIVFEGNSVYSAGDLLATIEAKKGELLNFKKMQDDIEKINARYKKDGYMLARVADVETDKQTHILRFQIVEGRVESIVLDGNDNTKDYVILREMNTKPGDVLNENVLKKDLRRVFNLGFFSEVTPNFETGSSKETVVLSLKIKETRSSTVNFGGGYGQTEGWFGFMDLSINNLMGTAQGLLVRGQVGQQLSTYQFRYTNPWFIPEKFGDHTSFTFRRYLTIGRDILLTTQDGIYNGFDVAVSKPLKENVSINWTLGSENASSYGTSTFDAYRSDTVSVGLAYDTRDFWLNPKEGRYYTLNTKLGFVTTDTTNLFLKIDSDLNHFYPVAENQVLAIHAGAGVGIEDVPIGELYWAGGPNTVRGYYPTDARTGKRKFIFNIEYRLNFTDMFQGVFFYDWGNAWSSGVPDPGSFLSGWGPGVRINTPMGPIRLDYGVPGGKTFSEGIMNFSIGQAF